MKTPNLDDTILHMRELEDENQHSEWLVSYAKHLSRDRRLAQAAEALLALHKHFGEMTRPLREVREQLYKQAKFVFEQRDPEAFKYARARGV